MADPVDINIPKKKIEGFWQKNKFFIIGGAVVAVVLIALLSFLG